MPKNESQNSTLIVSAESYFEEAVHEALENRRVRTFPMAQGYLAQVLHRHLDAEALFDDIDATGKKIRHTLAELFLRAANSESHMRFELLKKLADRSLYISGFFGDSLQRKLVDIDYYVEMGGTAYSALADASHEDAVSKVYREFALRFSEFVDVIGFIAAKASLQNEENIMRLYESYEMTGSSLARDRLLDMGLIAAPRTGRRQNQ